VKQCHSFKRKWWWFEGSKLMFLYRVAWSYRIIIYEVHKNSVQCFPNTWYMNDSPSWLLNNYCQPKWSIEWAVFPFNLYHVSGETCSTIHRPNRSKPTERVTLSLCACKLRFYVSHVYDFRNTVFEKHLQLIRVLWVTQKERTVLSHNILYITQILQNT